MKSLTRALALFAVCGLLATLPAGAESFTVILANGTAIESRYPPRPAAEDTGKLLLLTEWGNWIALGRGDIREVRSAATKGGFAGKVDTRARFVGAAPNDAPVPGAGPERPADESVAGAVLNHLLRQSLATIEERLLAAQANTVRQFGEPPVAGSAAATGFLIGVPAATGSRSFLPQPSTELDSEKLLQQGLLLPPTDPMKGWVLSQPTLVPLDGLAAAPPSLFWGRPPGG